MRREPSRYGTEDPVLATSQEAQLDPSFKFILTDIYVNSEPFTVYPGRLKSLVRQTSPNKLHKYYASSYKESTFQIYL